MMVTLTPELEARLVQVAREGGQTPEAFIAETMLHRLEGDEHDTEVIRERLVQADLGVFIEEEEMDRRFEQMTQR